MQHVFIMKIRFATLQVLGFFICLCSNAQLSKMGLDSEWNKGQIVLNDGKIYKGFIQYNDKMGLVRFRAHSSDSTDSESFGVRRIREMNFTNDNGRPLKNFLSVNGSFCEILRVYKHSALLLEIGRVENDIRTSTDKYGRTTSRKVGIIQFQRIYLAIEDSEPAVLLSGSVRQPDGIVSGKSRKIIRYKHYLNKKLLNQYTEKYAQEFSNFIKQERLNTKSREDLLKAIDYYNSDILKENN